MRLFEFDNQLEKTVASYLLPLKDLNGKSSEIGVNAFLNILKKDHIILSYEQLKDLYDKSSTLKNIIKNFDREKIKLTPEEEPTPTSSGTEEPEEQDDEKDSIEDKVDTMAKGSKGSDRVAKMATSAAKRRT